jgi:UDP-N-acetylmuramoylalanine--D-glutamate ligase
LSSQAGKITGVADWTNKKILVLGLGRSGVSAARYLAQRGAKVFLSDAGKVDDEKQKQLEELQAAGVRVETGAHSAEAMDYGELIITSPGIPPTAEPVRRARARRKEIICDVELAYRETKTPMIAVTGTNGKSTTCALISHILTKTGRVAPACGNFGVPILNQLDRKPDFLVVEVSSYQLEYCKAFAPLVGIWLNLTPDHLEWHGSLDAYIDAKRKLFANQRPDQYAILNEDDPVVSNTETRAQIFPFSASSQMDYAVQGAFVKEGFLAYRLNGRTNILCAPEELLIRGKHNVENVLAAISATALVGVDSKEIETHLKDFKALEHRLEFVDTIGGVAFYNDSKATNPDSTIKALESFPGEKIVLIAGGRDKGTYLGEFVDSVHKHVSSVILLGEAKERFAQALTEGGFAAVYTVDSMEEAVDLGAKLKQGPVVLSPACASFDMFRDYEDRGRVFKDLVRSRLEKLASSA